ncbi:hypothetical protein ABZ816_09350 [Actinosynnema sp. NPDC047251]|uniref:Uncharacterized protein n=1 Tax=Saccharothrix espanaensis (strain ATCC 51144 / DSM 44229 / JCM 9112 / NBRC 15066 / NRRL 15764) TaxID=1179773 RepID=K0K6R1_SACES|nr:hypothetical protein [Saccharothrix espanaensis]CCH34016.1 hypothetical protein BN6_67790 [Saccharothrix espanaensis DSM 44229]
MTTHPDPGTRLAGALLLISFVAMVAGAALVAPSGLTLNPADPVAALTAVRDQVGLHLAELALDVVGWLALTTAGLVVAGGRAGLRGHLAVPAGGLLAAAGLAGLLHDAGNLAVTRLAADPAHGSAEVALLTAKWGVNLAGLLWVAATVATTAALPGPRWLRWAGAAVAGSGLAAVVLPWTTGTAGVSPGLEQLGYALHLPVMLWYAVLGVRCLRGR